MDEMISNTFIKDRYEPEELEIILNSKYNSNGVYNLDLDLNTLENFRISSSDNLINSNKNICNVCYGNTFTIDKK